MIRSVSAVLADISSRAVGTALTVITGSSAQVYYKEVIVEKLLVPTLAYV
jgi:hypothetical protein